MKIALDVVEPSRTAVVSGPLDLSQFMSSLEAVYAFLRSRTDVTQTGQNVALYERERRMEVGVEVDAAFDSQGAVRPSWLPGGRVAHATHTTGYADLRETYAAIEGWCDANGLETAGVRWEIYGDPDDHNHVDVEVCFLVL